MRKLLSITCISMSLFFFSCQRELAEEDYIFRGDWDSKTYALQIYSNGYGVCNTKKWGGRTCEGFVKIKDDRIIFTSNQEDSTLPRKRFFIDKRPDIDDNGVTYMILSGERFEKR